MSQNRASGSRKPVLEAVVRDVRTFAMILRAIAFTPLCHISVADYGLQCTTGVNGVLTATAYLSAGIFNTYTYNAPPEDIDDTDGDVIPPVSIFEVSLSDFLVCLNIYGNAGISGPGKAKERDEDAAFRRDRDRRSATTGGGQVDTEMRILYEGMGHPLILELQEGKTSTRCELNTYESGGTSLTEIPFRSENLLDQVIMASKDITDVLQSIDPTSKDVTFSFSNDSRARTRRDKNGATLDISMLHPKSRASSSIIMSTAGSDDEETGRRSEEAETVQMMTIKSEGDNGSTELELPNQNRVFEQFLCVHDNSHTYQFADLQRCLKALQTSLKTSLRISDDGVMSLQCLFPKRAEQALNPHLDSAAANNRNIQSDPESQAYVELRMLPAYENE